MWLAVISLPISGACSEALSWNAGEEEPAALMAGGAACEYMTEEQAHEELRAAGETDFEQAPLPPQQVSFSLAVHSLSIVCLVKYLCAIYVCYVYIISDAKSCCLCASLRERERVCMYEKQKGRERKREREYGREQRSERWRGRKKERECAWGSVGVYVHVCLPTHPPTPKIT